ncbi:hypothetical protein NGM37_31175, partial [Streptomyces sp. TRM76130]|nr:hypothetical protein [Streptomyces sp. TRM76130]
MSPAAAGPRPRTRRPPGPWSTASRPSAAPTAGSTPGESTRTVAARLGSDSTRDVRPALTLEPVELTAHSVTGLLWV